ncbi:hypothetical protein [Priestia aryabhattai]
MTLKENKNLSDNAKNISFSTRKNGDWTGGYLKISPELLELICDRNFTFFELGIDTITNTWFLKFNNEGEGITLLNSHLKYEQVISASKMLRNIRKSDFNIDLSKCYNVIEINNNVFSLDKEITIDQYNETYCHSIKWLEDIEKNLRVKQPFIRFYSKKVEGKVLSPIMTLSNKLVELAYQKKMTHIEFGFDAKLQVIFVRLNSENKGISLLDSFGAYRSNNIGITKILNELENVRINVEFKTTYLLQLLTNNVYCLTKSFIPAQSNEIKWISSDEFYFSYEQYTADNFKINLSQDLITYLIKKQVTFVQFGSNKKNEIYIKLNNNGEGIPLISTKGTYKTSIGATNTINSINENKKLLNPNKKYYVDKIDSNLFKIQDVSTDLQHSETNLSQIIWHTNKKPSFKIRVIRTGKNKKKLYFSAGLQELIKNSKMTYLDIDINEKKQVVSFLMNDKGKGFAVEVDSKGNLTYQMLNDIYSSLELNEVDFITDCVYDVKQVSPVYYLVTPTQDKLLNHINGIGDGNYSIRAKVDNTLGNLEEPELDTNFNLNKKEIEEQRIKRREQRRQLLNKLDN